MADTQYNLVVIENTTAPDFGKQWDYYKNSNLLYLVKNDKQYLLKNIFNYITQAVNVDVALLLKGMRIIADDDTYKEILNAIYADLKKDLFALYLVVFGNAFLKLELDELQKTIKLKVLQTKQVDFEKDEDGNITRATYVYTRKTQDGTTENVREEYTKERIRRIIDGEKIEIDKENNYGFVPIYHFMFIDVGEKYGVNAFDHVCISQDVLNAYANVIYQIGAKMMDPIYLIRGNFSEKEKQKISQEFAKNIMEGVNVLVTTPDGGAEILEGGMENTEKALKFLDIIQENIEQNLPELLLTKIADKNASGYALNMMLLGLKTKIEGARENIRRELRLLNRDIFTVLVRWGKLSPTTENYADVVFDEVFDFMRTEKINEVEKELNMGLITEDIARQKLGIEWSGMENTNQKEDKKSETGEQQSLFQKIIKFFKNLFGGVAAKS